jgi:UDP-glucose 4-epimerase
MRILITGEKGYISQNLKRWINLNNPSAEVLAVSLREKMPDLSGYDVIVHTAAIVHRKINDKSDYYKINAGLTADLARKYKEQGGGHFIFLSTMAVYGQTGSLRTKLEINSKTPVMPKSDYAKSKLMAENELNSLAGEGFKLTVLRPPVVYGENCPGNYRFLRQIAMITPVFPYVRNERSMVHIDKLCREISYAAVNGAEGVFHPQDEYYHSTSETVKKLGAEYGRKIYLSEILGRIVLLCDLPVTRKVFGNLVLKL